MNIRELGDLILKPLFDVLRLVYAMVWRMAFVEFDEDVVVLVVYWEHKEFNKRR